MRLILGIIMFYARFGPSFTQIGYRWRQRKYQPLGEALAGRHIVITGASGGIGSAVVLGCIAHGATVTAVARNQQKLDALIPGGHERLNTHCTDLADSEDVQALARTLGDGQAIDALVNNVGVMLAQFETNARGIDAQFATNLLNQYVLTEQLIETDTLSKEGAVISVASGGMYMAPLSLDKLCSDNAQEHDGTTAYAVQKRAQVVLTGHWQDVYGPAGRRFYVMHPGWVDTAGVQNSLPTFRKILRPLLRNAEQGADTILWLMAALPAATGATRIWFDRAQRPVHAYGFTKGADKKTAALIELLQSYARPDDTIRK